MALDNVVRHLVELISVGVVDETITEDAEGLTQVQVEQVVVVLDVLEITHKHSLDNLGHISEIESVMALGGRGQEVGDGRHVDLHS